MNRLTELLRRGGSFSVASPKAYYKRQDLAEERVCWDLQREVVKQRSLRGKRLHSIPEVAEEELDGVDVLGQRLCFEDGGRPSTPRSQRRTAPSSYTRGNEPQDKGPRQLQRQRSSPRFTDDRCCYYPHHPHQQHHGSDERVLGRLNRQNTKSPDSGLDCGSEEEGSLGRSHRGYLAYGGGGCCSSRGPVHVIHCEGPVERRALAMGRKRTLTRQCSVEEEFSDGPLSTARAVHTGDFRNREHFGPRRETRSKNYSRDGALSEGRLNELDRVYYSPHRDARAQSLSRLTREQPLVCDSHFFCCNFPSSKLQAILFFNVVCLLLTPPPPCSLIHFFPSLAFPPFFYVFAFFFSFL